MMNEGKTISHYFSLSMKYYEKWNDERNFKRIKTSTSNGEIN
jgi:hypothetical protein